MMNRDGYKNPAASQIGSNHEEVFPETGTLDRNIKSIKSFL